MTLPLWGRAMDAASTERRVAHARGASCGRSAGRGVRWCGRVQMSRSVRGGREYEMPGRSGDDACERWSAYNGKHRSEIEGAGICRK